MGFDMNYKIKVESNVEEIQDLFIQLGCKYFNHTVSDKNYMLIEDGKAFFYKFKKSFDKSKSKEITLPELRDLVVLKRNSVDDATHENSFFCYIELSDGWYFFDMDVRKWLRSTGGKPEYYEKLKPIEKKEMKEYLEKQTNGRYVMKSGFALAPADWIEIPKGSVKAYLNNSGTINFVNADDDYMNGVTRGEWVDTHRGKHESSGHQLVWQRESPNDKLASAEQYRQAEVLPFIDDEPKNVEQGSIEQTLAQRQSQYGCFEDVAFVTQGMIELMRKCNYDKMPASHQMALSMICSKMARIVNGDFNHKDSWHDIGGYAKLIEDEIFDETEMPF